MVRTAVLAVALLALAAPALAANDDLAPLLAKLAAAEDRAHPIYREWNYTIKMNADELDSKGKPQSTTKVELRHSFENGEEKQTLVHEEKDGKDITKERQEKQKAREEKRDAAKKDAKKDEGDDDEFPSPFGTKEQPKYVFTRLGPDRIGFAPKVPSKDAMKGDAVVDATGRLKTVTMTPSKMPAMVSVLEITMELGNGDAETPLLSDLEVHGEGGVLFIKKRFRASTIFSDFAKPAAAPK